MVKKLQHYLDGSTNFGGANGYISNFMKDLDREQASLYASINHCENCDILVFHRSDGLKIRLKSYLSSLVHRSNRTKFIQTFHNPTLPYLEKFYNAPTLKNAVEIPFLQLKFYLSVILCDAMYFASKNSIASYQDPVFRWLTNAKKVGFFSTKIACESVPYHKANDTDENAELTFGFLGREMKVKGADIFEKISQNASNNIFVATWEPNVSKHNSRVKRIGRQDKWAFLDAIDALIVPNRHCYYDLVILEALNRECTVIASNVGGTIDICHPNLIKVPLEHLINTNLEKVLQLRPNTDDETTVTIQTSKNIRESFTTFLVQLLQSA